MPPVLLAVLVLLSSTLTLASAMWCYLMWKAIQDRWEQDRQRENHETLADMFAAQEDYRR